MPFASPTAMVHVLEQLGGGDQPSNTGAFLDVLVAALAECPDPDRALLNLNLLAEASGNRISFCAGLIESPDLRRDLLRVLSHSQVFANVLVAAPERLDVLRLVGAPPPSREELVAQGWAACAHMPTKLSRLNALRRFRKRELLRIGVGDILERLTFAEVVEALSTLAGACLEVCLRLVTRDLADEFGRPLDEAGAEVPFAIVALGKLGGNELNYASDVDVLFVCGGQGRTDGRRPVAAVDYFDRVARAVISGMSEPLEEGFVFRVDARLRPQGRSGPLVRSVESALAYYSSHGQAWERQALLKARQCAGDAELGRRFVDATRPFVFGRRLDSSDLSELLRLRLQYEARSQSAGTWERDLKHGPGGIRDVEYTVQLLALIAGEEHPDLRTPNTLLAIERLTEAGALTPAEARDLSRGYVLARRAEHAVQVRDERQTHILPDDPRELGILARRLGLSGGDELWGLWRGHSAAVQSVFEGVLSEAPGGDGEARRSPLQQHVLGVLPSPEPAERELRSLGFSEPAEALDVLAAMAAPESSLDEDPAEALCAIVEPMCERASRSGDPDAALRGLAALTPLSGGRRRFYTLLREAPTAADLLAMLAGRSRFLTRWLQEHPELLDAAIDPALLTEERDTAAYESAVARTLAGATTLARVAERLRRTRRRELLRIGLRDVADIADLHELARDITRLAEACLRAALPLCAAEAGPGAERLSLVAMGSFGGRDLHFSSDLDVVFAADPNGGAEECQAADAAARALIREFSEPGPGGVLYRIDPRLRPEGASGTLVPQLGAVRVYLADRASLWERVAATRARAVAGDAPTAARLAEAYRAFAYSAPFSADERVELDGIRGRVEDERDKSTEGALDLKLCRGGLMDLEYGVRIVQVAAGLQSKAVRVPGLWEAIRMLARLRVIPPVLSERLSAAWRLLKGLEMRLQIVHEEPSGLLDLSPDALAVMGRKLHRSVAQAPISGDELRDRVAATTQTVRGFYERVIAEGQALDG